MLINCIQPLPFNFFTVIIKIQTYTDQTESFPFFILLLINYLLGCYGMEFIETRISLRRTWNISSSFSLFSLFNQIIGDNQEWMTLVTSLRQLQFQLHFYIKRKKRSKKENKNTKEIHSTVPFDLFHHQ